MLRAVFRSIRKSKYHYAPLVEVRIFRQRILNNFFVFQKMLPSGVRVAPVLKSNAYGHGLVHIAQCLSGTDVPFFAVDSYYEALVLRNEGIKTPLVVIGYTAKENMFQNNLSDVSFTLISKEEIIELSKNNILSCRVHIKIDTGMHRQGIRSEECDEVIALLNKAKHITVEGISTHFADADSVTEDYTRTQIQEWNTVVQKFRAAFPAMRYVHAAATCGSFFSQSIDANVMRLGIGLYGIAPCAKQMGLLAPALEMRSVVSSVRQIQKGESVGYNCAYTAANAMRIATVPVGYFEGVDRRLSNKGYVRIQGMECSIIGRVSMNIISVDVSAVSTVRIGDTVVVFSAQSHDKNSVEQSARLCETIPYEILIRIPAQVRRVVIREE